MKNIVIKHQKTDSAQCTYADGTGIAGQQCSFAEMPSGTDLAGDTGKASLPAYNEFDLSLDYNIKNETFFSLLINVLKFPVN